jgi:formylglycine-generating enzyme required for sulfatase activity
MKIQLHLSAAALFLAMSLVVSCDEGGGSAAPSFSTFPAGDYVQSDGTRSFVHTISSFEMARHEVTYALWHEVYQWATHADRGGEVYSFANQGREGHDGGDGGAPTGSRKEPVTLVSWRDAIAWCNAFSEMESLEPAYYYDVDFAEPLRDSRDSNAAECDGAVVNWNADGYRLPSEGEWQYAASYINGSAWTPWDCASGDSLSADTSASVGRYAWFADNSDGRTHGVGSRSANARGVRDMSGNVWEWCWDRYGVYPGNYTDYRGPESGVSRVYRGGSWSSVRAALRLGGRGCANSYYRDNATGFRIARSLP